MSHIPLTAGPTVPFTPDAIGTFVPAEGDPLNGGKAAYVIKHPDIEFFVRVPTWEDRDMVSLRLYTMGVREVTADNIQHLIVSELFEVMEEDEADEAARFCEGFWARQRMHNIDMQRWGEQEAIRQGDEIAAGRKFEATPPPPETTTARERARINLIAADVTDGSERLRNKIADQQLYTKRFAAAVTRLMIAGWKGLKTEAQWDARPSLDAPTLSKETIEQLRSELMELDATGAAWEELTNFCERQFDLPRSAEKNSHSPVANISGQATSTTKNSASENNDGSSTSKGATGRKKGSSSGRTRGGTSAPTTGTSSGSSPDSGTAT
jgi:hypothetical protein